MKFDGEIIHSERDQYGLIQVVDTPTTRKLYFDSPIEQSCLYLNAPMTLNFEYQQKIIELLLAFAANCKNNRPIRVLMLGMGGGSIAHHLFQSYAGLQMTVVELRQAVIDCAYRFFQLPDEPEIEVVQANAIDYIAHNQHAYDAIIVDIFDANGLPSEISQPAFLTGLLKNIKTPGSLILNLWFEWDTKQPSGKPIPTEETQAILKHFQNLNDQDSHYQLNRYNIQSSQNLILEILKK